MLFRKVNEFLTKAADKAEESGKFYILWWAGAIIVVGGLMWGFQALFS